MRLRTHILFAASFGRSSETLLPSVVTNNRNPLDLFNLTPTVEQEVNEMNLPGFTATAALYSVSNHYYVHGIYRHTSQEVYAARFLDQTCLSNCKQDCGFMCSDTSGLNKAFCIRECALDNAECNTICRR